RRLVRALPDRVPPPSVAEADLAPAACARCARLAHTARGEPQTEAGHAGEGEKGSAIDVHWKVLLSTLIRNTRCRRAGRREMHVALPCTRSDPPRAHPVSEHRMTLRRQ